MVRGICRRHSAVAPVSIILIVAFLCIDFLAWYSNLHVVEQCMLNHLYYGAILELPITTMIVILAF